MTSRRSYLPSDDDDERISSRASSRTHPKTFEFEQSEEEITVRREPLRQTEERPSSSDTGPHSPVHSRDAPPMYVEEYTTTYTKIVRSTEQLDRIPNDPEPLNFPPEFSEFERLEDVRPHSFVFQEIEKAFPAHGFGSDRYTPGSSSGSPRRTKSLSSFQDVDDEDYGFVAVPYTRSDRIAHSGRGTTRGRKVMKSVEKWETENHAANGNLVRSTSEKGLNGVDHPSHQKRTDTPEMRDQSWKDVSNPSRVLEGRGVVVEYEDYLEASQLDVIQPKKASDEQVNSPTNIQFITEVRSFCI